jgi:alginate O-acetyltransferase complex protein AlgI
VLFHNPIFLFIFLPIVLVSYLFIIKYSVKAAQYTLVFSGIIFYAWWNVALTPIIIISIIFNFILGNLIKKSTIEFYKKLLLFISILFNVVYLAIFKYLDFIYENINYFFNTDLTLLNMPFPLAMSFFTFQTIAYLVDCYNKEISKNSFREYSLFIIFFPQLIAGPIVTYNNMLPQFNDEKNKLLNNKSIYLGLAVILIGLFKKIFLADNLSVLVDEGFLNHQNLEFFSSWMASLFFTFQIYFDFSGYIDMATGIALLFNIRLPQNFNSPYKALGIINFWQRWHITLTNFLTNYIYYPWVKSLKNLTFFKAMVITFAVFILAGIWHGPSWLYVVFGCLHGLGLVINHSFKKFFKLNLNKYISWFITFNYINFAFIFFRSQSFEMAFNILKSMVGLNGVNLMVLNEQNFSGILILVASFFICLLFKNTNFLIDHFKQTNLDK